MSNLSSRAGASRVSLATKPQELTPTQLGLPGLDLVRDFVEHTGNGKTNTVELFDALVLYSPDRARIGEEFLEAQKIFRGKTFHVRVSPAVLKVNGKPRMILPGRRENLVEKALRKIAAEDEESLSFAKDNAGNQDAGVYFTMYRLRKVLHEQGHDFNLKQLHEALEVLVGTRLTIKGDLPTDVLEYAGEGFLRDYTKKTPKVGDPSGESNYVHVKFHHFVTRSLIQKTFRRIDFAKLMRPKSELARWLYSRISHNYIQAASDDHTRFAQGESRGYHISLTTIIREFALGFSDLRIGARAVRNALEAMREEGILRRTNWVGQPYVGYTEKVSYAEKSGRGRRPISDVVWHLFPSQEVIDDIITANKSQVVMAKKGALELVRPSDPFENRV